MQIYSLKGNFTRTKSSKSRESVIRHSNHFDSRKAWGSTCVSTKGRTQMQHSSDKSPCYPLWPGRSGTQTGKSTQSTVLAEQVSNIKICQKRQTSQSNQSQSKKKKNLTITSAQTFAQQQKAQIKDNIKPQIAKETGPRNPLAQFKSIGSIGSKVRSTRPMTSYPSTSGAVSSKSNQRSVSGVLCSNSNQSRQRAQSRTRHIMQSSQKLSRIDAQSQINVPQSSYGSRPVAMSTCFKRGLLADKRKMNFLKQCIKPYSFKNKVEEIKHLRMSNYISSPKQVVQNTPSQSLASSSNFMQRSQSVRVAENQQQQPNLSRIKIQMACNSRSPAQSGNTRKSKKANGMLVKSQNQLRDMILAELGKNSTVKIKAENKFQIQSIDKIIKVEEDMRNGFSMYSRGRNLKKSLINHERVLQYLQSVNKKVEVANFAADQRKRNGVPADQISVEDPISLDDQSLHLINENKIKEQSLDMPKLPDPIEIRGDPDLKFLKNNRMKECKQWDLMLDYFQKNPDALLDAIPTPKGNEKEEVLSELGLNKNYNSDDGVQTISQLQRSRSRTRSRQKRQQTFSEISSQTEDSSILEQSAQLSKSQFSRASLRSKGQLLSDEAIRAAQNVLTNYSINSKRPSESSRIAQRDLNQSISSYRKKNSNLNSRNTDYPRQSYIADIQSKRTQKQQKSFRINCKRSMKQAKISAQPYGVSGLSPQGCHLKRLQEKRQEEQKQIFSKKNQTERIKVMLFKKSQNSYENHPKNTVCKFGRTQQPYQDNSSSLPSSISQPETRNQNNNTRMEVDTPNQEVDMKAQKVELQYIDWNKSYTYRHLIVRHANDKQRFESEQMILEDEAQYLNKLIRGYRFRKSWFKIEELVSVLPVMTQKCFHTIEMIYKEILTEAYWEIEYEHMVKNKLYQSTEVPFGYSVHATKIFTLEKLLQRISVLKNFRREIKTFLNIIHQRELVLKQMHIAVEQINDKNFFNPQYDIKAKKSDVHQDDHKSDNSSSKSDEIVVSYHQTRHEILQMGNNLADLTDQILQHQVKFFRIFNKQFTKVELKVFIFQEANYLEIAIKEVQEISQIFQAYGIEIKELQNIHLYKKNQWLKQQSKSQFCAQNSSNQNLDQQDPV